jgi:formiminotetrahydrofolate cyclodeaminase
MMTNRPGTSLHVTDPTEAYLEALASGAPTPGGGSAAALVGAVGAALVAMVARLTVDKPTLTHAHADARRLIAEADAARDELRAAMAEDEAAFTAVLDAYRLPRDTQTARDARRAFIASASRRATIPPLTTARIARNVLDLALAVARIGNPQVTSDAAVAAWVAYAALRASVVNVRTNLPAARDPSFSVQCEAEIEALLVDAFATAEAAQQVGQQS